MVNWTLEGISGLGWILPRENKWSDKQKYFWHLILNGFTNKLSAYTWNQITACTFGQRISLITNINLWKFIGTVLSRCLIRASRTLINPRSKSGVAIWRSTICLLSRRACSILYYAEARFHSGSYRCFWMLWEGMTLSDGLFSSEIDYSLLFVTGRESSYSHGMLL